MLQNVQGAKDKTALLQQHHVFVMIVQLFKVSTNDERMMLAEKQYKLFHLFFSEKRVGYGGDNFSTTTGLQLIHHYRASRARGWRLANTQAHGIQESGRPRWWCLQQVFESEAGDNEARAVCGIGNGEALRGLAAACPHPSRLLVRV